MIKKLEGDYIFIKGEKEQRPCLTRSQKEKKIIKFIPKRKSSHYYFIVSTYTYDKKILNRSRKLQDINKTETQEILKQLRVSSIIKNSCVSYLCEYKIPVSALR